MHLTDYMRLEDVTDAPCVIHLFVVFNPSAALMKWMLMINMKVVTFRVDRARCLTSMYLATTP